MWSKNLGITALVLAVGLAAVTDAQAARRLGGGKSVGMQRDHVTAPAKSAPGTPGQATPGQPATGSPGQAPAAQAARPATAGAPAAAAAAPNRSRWLAPLAGLAAGLGLAALASHFGFGEQLANLMTVVLLALVVMAVIGFILRRRAGNAAPAMAGAGAGGWQQPPGAGSPLGQPQVLQRNDLDAQPPRAGSLIGSRIGSALLPAAVPGEAAALPAGFDAEGFSRNAKAQFLALQQANDARDLGKLREFLTPQMFEMVREDLASQPAGTQTTEVYGLEAQVLQVEEEAADYIVSVRFSGRIRHEAGAEPEDFDELWHLTKPRFGAGGWVIAGIRQLA